MARGGDGQRFFATRRDFRIVATTAPPFQAGSSQAADWPLLKRALHQHQDQILRRRKNSRIWLAHNAEGPEWCGPFMASMALSPEATGLANQHTAGRRPAEGGQRATPGSQFFSQFTELRLDQVARSVNALPPPSNSRCCAAGAGMNTRSQ